MYMVEAQITTHELKKEEIFQQTDIVVGEFIDKPGALIPILQTLQHIFGYRPL